jgi:ATP-dependent RNA helicase RhlE
VLSPTRELAAQIGESFETYGRNTRISCAVIFGGVGQLGQEQALRRGADVVVATPGRFLDLMGQGLVKLADLEVFVLDEADRMLDMGFIHDVRKVVAVLPRVRQTLFFSATMPREVQALADGLLTDPARLEVTPVATTAEKVAQSVYFVERGDKRALLEQLLRTADVRRALVFTRTKHGANRLADQLVRADIPALAIHGNKSQNARERALSGFKAGTTRVLVATDIAARGIDVEGITHVINYELPNVPESYVHRIGRTARAGADGVAWSLCDAEERAFLRDIERLIRMRVPAVEDHPYRSATPYDPHGHGGGGANRNGSGGGGGGGGNGSHRGGGSLHTPRTGHPAGRNPAHGGAASAPHAPRVPGTHHRPATASPPASHGAPHGGGGSGSGSGGGSGAGAARPGGAQGGSRHIVASARPAGSRGHGRGHGGRTS